MCIRDSILLTNKVVLDAATIASLPDLKYIGVLATGYNIVDTAAAKERGIIVTNIPAYSTPSVAQMVFAHILNIAQQVQHYTDEIRNGRWSDSPDFCFWDTPLIELRGKKIGIIGLGQTGYNTARIAIGFGMEVHAYTSKSPFQLPPEIKKTELDELFANCDIISLHCPLTDSTRELINAARLGIGAQSVGLCEAAYREALKYAQEREQFGKPIIRFAAVAEMLSNMKAKLQGVRALLYETTRFVEVYKQYGHIAHERPLEGDERQEMKFYNRLADGFTPLVKLFSSEYANQQAYDAIQIHGGSGFMKDYPCERLYRDARIMNIYEGTSQLQVVAAINAVTKGTFMEQIERYAAAEYSQPMQPVVAKLKELTAKFSEMTAHVEAGDKELCGFKDFHARRLVETAGHIIITYLLARQAGESEEYADSAKIFCKLAEGKISEAYTYVMNSTLEDVALFRAGE